MLNSVALMGRLTRDPELKTTPGGKSVCTVTLAVERDFADANGVREADFIDVVAWGKTAEFVARYFHKGLLVSCQGRLQARKWRDRYEQNRTAVEVTAEHMYFAERSERPAPGGSDSGASQRSVRGGREGETGAAQPSGGAGKEAGWHFQRQAADVAAPEYAGDLYRGGASGDADKPGAWGAEARDRLFQAYNEGAWELPQSDFAGMEDEDVPF